jgi:hypothetical protein
VVHNFAITSYDVTVTDSNGKTYAFSVKSPSSSLALSGPLTPGAYTATVYAIDSQGFAGAVSAPVSFTIAPAGAAPGGAGGAAANTGTSPPPVAANPGASPAPVVANPGAPPAPVVANPVSSPPYANQPAATTPILTAASTTTNTASTTETHTATAGSKHTEHRHAGSSHFASRHRHRFGGRVRLSPDHVRRPPVRPR